MSEQPIADRVKRILATIPEGVILVAAAKSRTVDEMRAAIEAGITCVGHNYVQEAMSIIPQIKNLARCHMIGHHKQDHARSC